MREYAHSHHMFVKNAFGIVLILVGLFALITPLTPGSWLAPIGLYMLIGKQRTTKLLEKLKIGKKKHEIV